MGRTLPLFFFLEKNGMTWEALFYSNFLTLKTIAEYFVQFCTPWGIMKWWNYWTTAHLTVPQGLPLQSTVGFLDLRAAQADFLIFLSGFPSLWSPRQVFLIANYFFFSKCDFRNRKILSFLKEWRHSCLQALLSWHHQPSAGWQLNHLKEPNSKRSTWEEKGK